MAQQSPAKKAQHAAEQAATEGHRAGEAARDGIRDLKQDATGRMDAAKDWARDAADDHVRATTDTGAEQVERTARAFEDAAGEYRKGSMPSEALHRVSGFLEDTARDLRDTDLETVTTGVSRFARRNPVLFVAGAAAVGFAAARLLRAGDTDERDTDERGTDERGTSDSAPAETGSAPAAPAAPTATEQGRTGGAA